MKALIKGGLCLALGWLANNAAAQEVRWEAFTPKNNSPIAVISPSMNASTAGDTIRPVSLTEAVPPEPGKEAATKPGSIRPILGSSLPIVRGQAPDNMMVPPLPTVSGQEIIPIPAPRTMPSDKNFPAPPPAPYTVIPMPSDSVWNSLSAPGDFPSVAGNCCLPQSCSPFTCGNGCCPDRSRFWVSGEYLMWWQRSDSVPPLVTSSPPPFVDGSSGVLGGPNTTNVFDSFPNHVRSGARFDAGMWFDRSSNFGIEANFLFLGRQDDSATFASNGDPLLFRPFYSLNPLTGTVTPAAEDVANPAGRQPVTGSVTVDHFTQLWGIEGNGRYKWLCGPNYWVDILGGYRHLNLSEGIDITENLTPTDGNPLAPRIVQDSFHTRDEFNGLQLGLDSQWRLWNRVSLGGTFKLAMGATHEIVNINGSTTFFTPNTVVQQGGLYALPSNIGRYTADRFAVLPEVGLKISYDITDHLSVYLGYNVVYLSNVVRPGEQIDQTVNTTYQPTVAGPGTQIGPARPAVLFRTSDYWAQGLNFGLLYKF